MHSRLFVRKNTTGENNSPRIMFRSKAEYCLSRNVSFGHGCGLTSGPKRDICCSDRCCREFGWRNRIGNHFAQPQDSHHRADAFWGWSIRSVYFRDASNSGWNYVCNQRSLDYLRCSRAQLFVVSVSESRSGLEIVGCVFQGGAGSCVRSLEIRSYIGLRIGGALVSGVTWLSPALQAVLCH